MAPNRIQRTLDPIPQLAPNRRRFSTLGYENRPLFAAFLEFENGRLGENVKGEIFQAGGGEESLDAVGGEAVVFDGVSGGWLAVGLAVVMVVVVAATTMRMSPVLKRQEINNDQNPRLGFQPLGQTLHRQRRIFKVVESKSYRCNIKIVEIRSAELGWYDGA